jgi:phospholipase D1/2
MIFKSFLNVPHRKPVLVRSRAIHSYSIVTDCDLFSISSTTDDDVVTNKIARALADRIIRAGQEGKRFKVVIIIPEVPGFAGDIKKETSLKTIMAAQYRTINRGGHSIYEKVRGAGYEP